MLPYTTETQIKQAVVEAEERYKKIPAHLRLLREERGLTQKEMAGFMHMHPTAYNRLENSGAGLSLETILSASLILKVHPGVLLGINPESLAMWQGIEEMDKPRRQLFDIVLKGFLGEDRLQVTFEKDGGVSVKIGGKDEE